MCELGLKKNCCLWRRGGGLFKSQIASQVAPEMDMNMFQCAQLQCQSHVMTMTGNVLGLISGLSKGDFIVSCNAVLW